MRSRSFGLLLMLVAFVLLVTAPDQFSVWNMLGFLVCFVPGMLFVLGVLGRSSRIATAVASAAATPASGRVGPERREFRYPKPGWPQGLVYVVLTLLFVGLGAFIAVAGTADAKFVTLPMLLFAVLLWLYLWAHHAQHIVVDPRGIRARGYLRTVSLDWNDVAALQELTVRSPTAGPIGQIYRIHSPKGVIGFSGALVGAADLYRIVRETTGLEWGG